MTLRSRAWLLLEPLLWISSYFVLAALLDLATGDPTVSTMTADGAVAVGLLCRCRDVPRRPPRGSWPAFVAVLVAIWLIGQGTAGWLYVHGQQEAFDSVTSSQQHAAGWQLLVLGVVLAPVAEEVLLRGILYARLRVMLAVWPAALISATVFALLHRNLVQIAYTLPLGVLLALVYEATHRVMYTVLLHAGFNAAALLLPLPAPTSLLPVVVGNLVLAAALVTVGRTLTTAANEITAPGTPGPDRR